MFKRMKDAMLRAAAACFKKVSQAIQFVQEKVRELVQRARAVMPFVKPVPRELSAESMALATEQGLIDEEAAKLLASVPGGEALLKLLGMADEKLAALELKLAPQPA